MRKTLRIVAAAAAVSFSFAAASQAAMVTYANTDPTPKAQLTIDDAEAPNTLRFSLSTLMGTGRGQKTLSRAAYFFQISGGWPFRDPVISMVTLDAGRTSAQKLR